MATGDIKAYKQNAGGSFDEIVLTAADILAMAKTIFITQSNLTIDGSSGNYYLISISANASFSLSNIATGTQYYFRIKNTGAAKITVTLPNTADIKAALTFDIAAGKYKEVAMIYDGTYRTWEIGEELT